MSATVKARAAMSTSTGDVEVVDVTLSAPEEDEVLVAIQASGICHTDLDVAEHEPGVLLGHEGAGIVQAVGPNVTSLTTGDHVLLNWAIPCYSCSQCAGGRAHLCSRGPLAAGGGAVERHARRSATKVAGESPMRSFNIGTLASHTLVRESAAIKIPTSLPFEIAAIMGCAVMTGFGSVVNSASVEAGSTVVVIGAGSVGINVVQGALVAGAARIVVLDLDQSRLARAESYGATDTKQLSVDSSFDDMKNAVESLLNGRLADYAFEATAVPQLAAAPLALIRHGGTAVQISGVEQPISIDMSLFEWDKTYLNPLYGGCQPKRDFARLTDLYDSGEIELAAQIDARYDLENIAEAIDAYRDGRIMKAVITPKAHAQ